MSEETCYSIITRKIYRSQRRGLLANLNKDFILIHSKLTNGCYLSKEEFCLQLTAY